MKGNRGPLVLAGIFAWFLVVVSATAAVTGGIATDPSVINVTGVSGGTEDLTLAFVANESIQNLSLVTLDLRDDSTSARIKARQITVADVPRSMGKNDINTTEVWFNFTGVGPGRYSGQFWLSYNDGNKTPVPVKATVKMDWWPWPVVVLGLTLVTSFLLFYYREHFKRRDEILKSLLVVNQKIRDDTDDLDHKYGDEDVADTWFQNPFGTALNRKAGLVREHLELDRIAEAEASYKDLLDCWARWVGEKYEWKKFFVVCADVLKRQQTQEAKRRVLIEISGFSGMKLAEARNKIEGLPKTTDKEVTVEPAGFFGWLARIANNAYIAAVRLAVFEWASAFVTMGILIAFGMLTFYFNNPTFGANPADLIILALWGLFAGQLSEGVMKQVQGGVPALPKPPAS